MPEARDNHGGMAPIVVIGEQKRADDRSSWLLQNSEAVGGTGSAIEVQTRPT